MVPIAGLWVNVSIGMSTNNAMVNTPYHLPLLSVVSVLPLPHSIRGKMLLVLTTRLPCRWQPPLV